MLLNGGALGLKPRLPRKVLFDDGVVFFCFLLSAFCNFPFFILAIITLSAETEMLMTGRMRHERDTVGVDCNHGVKKYLICILGIRWYLACLCPAIKSALPDMRIALFTDGHHRPLGD